MSWGKPMLRSTIMSWTSYKRPQLPSSICSFIDFKSIWRKSLLLNWLLSRSYPWQILRIVNILILVFGALLKVLLVIMVLLCSKISFKTLQRKWTGKWYSRKMAKRKQNLLEVGLGGGMESVTAELRFTVQQHMQRKVLVLMTAIKLLVIPRQVDLLPLQLRLKILV